MRKISNLQTSILMIKFQNTSKLALDFRVTSSKYPRLIPTNVFYPSEVWEEAVSSGASTAEIASPRTRSAIVGKAWSDLTGRLKRSFIFGTISPLIEQSGGGATRPGTLSACPTTVLPQT